MLSSFVSLGRMAGKALRFDTLEEVLRAGEILSDEASSACDNLDFERCLELATNAVELLDPIEGFNRVRHECNYMKAFALESQGRTEEAEALYRSSYEECLRLLGPCEVTIDSLMAVVNLAACALHDFETGRVLVEKFLDSYGEELDHRLHGRLLQELAYLQSDMGRHEEADELLEKSIAMLQNGDAARSRQLLVALNLQAAIHQERGRLDAALAVSKNALAVALEQGDGVEDAKERLASVLLSLGEYQRALPHYEGLVAEFEAIEGQTGHTTRKCLFYLVGIYVVLGRLSEAQITAEKVMAMRKAFDSHPFELGYALHDYCEFLQGAHFYEAAFKVAKDNYEHSKAYLPDDDEFLGNVVFDLGKAQLNVSRVHEAKALYKRALSIQTLANGEKHPETVTAMCRLGTLYLTFGRPTKAVTLLRAGIAAFLSIGTYSRLHALQQSAQAALALVDLGMITDAFQLASEALDGIQELLPSTTGHVLAHKAMAMVEFGGGRHEEGMRHAQACHTILTDIYGRFESYRGSNNVADVCILLAEGALQCGSYNSALDHIQAADEMVARVQSQVTCKEEHYLAGQVRWVHGKVLLAQHKAAKAVGELRAAEALYVEKFGEKHPHWHLGAVRVALGRALKACDQHSDGEAKAAIGRAVLVATLGAEQATKVEAAVPC